MNAPTQPPATRHTWPPRFIFISGRLCLDFAHTGGLDWRSAWERFFTPADLADWLAVSPLHLTGVPVTPSELETALALREAIWFSAIACWQGQPLDAAHTALLNQVAAGVDLIPQISASGERTWLPAATASTALATLARDAIDLFSGELRQRIRQCENPTCSLMFVDTSRPGRRRWCSMERCGNLVKTARYRRRKETE